MLFGFSLGFFAVYGLQMEIFSTLGISIVSGWRMSTGDFYFDEMSNVNANYTSPIYVIFKVTFTILLQNMFIAIISAHYF